MNAARILVVDDDREMCEELSELLSREGYAVDITHDGTEGKRMVDSKRYEIVILDLKLPGLDGSDLLRHIKSNRSSRVIVITGAPIGSALYDTLRNGTAPDIPTTGMADGFAEKPFDVQRILDTIKRISTA